MSLDDATITFSLLCSCLVCLHPSAEKANEFSAKDSKLGSAQLIQKCFSFLLKEKPK